MDESEPTIDQLIEEVHAGAPPDIGTFGDEPSRRALLVLSKGDAILSFWSMPPFDWSSEFADEIADELEEERVEELRSGSELSEGELELWESAREGLWSINTSLTIYRAIDAQNPDRRIYVGWLSQFCGQGGDDLAWAGPYPEVGALLDFSIARTRAWRATRVDSDFTELSELDAFPAENFAGDGLDERDREEAESLFLAVKAARAIGE